MDQSLLNDFITETQELLQEMEASVLRLGEDHQNRDIVDDIFRLIHTIKGSSEYLGMADISEIAHKLENLLDLVRQTKRTVDGRMIQLLIDARDRISLLLDAVDAPNSEAIAIDDLIAEIEALSGGEEQANQSLLPDGTEALDSRMQGDSQETDEEGMLSEIANDDEEIVAIFLEQFKDGYNAFSEAVISLATSSSKEEYFSGSIAALESLRSSSNYMGYDQLYGFYEEWIDLITASRDTIVNGGAPDTASFFKICIDPMVAKLSRWLPRSRVGFSLEIPLPATTVDGTDSVEEVDSDIGGHDQISSETFTDLALDLMSNAESDPSEANPLDEISDDFLHDEELSLDDTLTLSGEPIELSSTNNDLFPESMGEESLLEEFIEEAREHLQNTDTALLAMLEGDASKELVDDTFRSIHTVKGSAEYLGLEKASLLLHKMESLLDLIRQGVCEADRKTLANLLAAKDTVNQLVEASMDSQALAQIEIADVLELLEPVESPAKDIEPEATAVPTDDGMTDGEQGAFAAGDELVAEVLDDFNEDYDEELFSIFLDQFDDNLDAIDRVLADQAAAGSVDQVLTQVLESIRNLKNSANYMGYERLCRLYDEQCDDIVAFLSDGAASDEAAGTTFIESVIQPWLEKIRSLLHSEVLSRPDDPDIAANEEIYGSEHDLEPFKQDIDNILEEHDVFESEDSGAFDQTDMDIPEPALSNTITLFPADDLNAEEQELFKKLETAFNSSMPGAVENAPERENGLLVSELFSTHLPEKSAIDECEPDSLEDGSDPAPVAEEGGLLHDMLNKMVDDTSMGSSLKTLADLLPNEPECDVAVEESDAPPVVQDTEVRTIDDIFSIQPPVPVDIVPEEPVDPPPVAEKAKKHNIRVDASKIDLLMNQVGELVVNRSVFTQLTNDLRLLQQYFKQDLDLNKKELKPIQDLAFRLGEATVSLGRVANELQEGVMKVRMLPISQLFNRYPRLVHDLTSKADKKVHLDIQGAETELDRMVIEEISDPLVHIIRNAVDHGIETTEERSAAGKPESGTISLTAYHESNNVVIEIVDDGKGLDIEKIRIRAVENGLIAEGDAVCLPMGKLVDLITQPGFSTADSITHTSGRGVGMDVVKKNIEKLNGNLEIDSMPGKGTKIRIKIPLTLAIFSALLVRVEDELYTVPLASVEETLRIREEEINMVEGVEVIYLRDEPVPLLPLSKLFNKRASVVGDSGKMYAVIVNNGKMRVGLIVDSLLGQEEVVIKPLEDYLQEHSGFSGATILGDGQISLILDVYELMKITMDRKSKVAAEALI